MLVKTWPTFPMAPCLVQWNMQGISENVAQVQSFVGPLRFAEAAAAIPHDTLLLEIGPQAVLQAPLRRNCPSHQ